RAEQRGRAHCGGVAERGRAATERGERDHWRQHAHAREIDARPEGQLPRLEMAGPEQPLERQEPEAQVAVAQVCDNGVRDEAFSAGRPVGELTLRERGIDVHEPVEARQHQWLSAAKRGRRGPYGEPYGGRRAYIDPPAA